MTAIKLILLTLAASAVAGPLSSSGPCARQCTERSKFQYKPGTSYYFDYESHAVTSMQGATDEESRLHMKARVQIHALSKCDFLMTLSGVSLEQSDPRNEKSRTAVESQEEFARSLERHGLRFSFQDGTVESICPSDAEIPRDLNIKRGILSLLQTSVDSLDTRQKITEVDVNGECETRYEPESRGWNSISVRKLKDMSTCTQRHSAHSFIQVNPFFAGKSSPLVKGSQECEQTFKQERLESVRCWERHSFRPFSRQESGAVTKLTQTMTFAREEKASVPAEFSTLRKAMTFEHEADPEDHERLVRQAQQALADLCTASRDDIRPSVPAKFTAFVYTLRPLQHPDIVSLHQRLESICQQNAKAKSIFLDAVSMAETAGAVKFVVDRIQRGEMTEKEADLWISTLAFISKPDKDVLEALKPLVEPKRLNAILPVSAVVHSYCKHHEDCGLKKEVQQIVDKISQLLGSKCNGDREKVILALKALGNMGVSLGAEQKLQACAQEHSLSTEVRVAAIQAYRRFSCDVQRDPIMSLYQDPEEDEEVRIAAFLNIMRCSSQPTLSKIKSTLENDKSIQVGSFVMSYLKTMLKQQPENERLREIVSKLENMHKFDRDFRRSSRHYEAGFYLDSLEAGASVESDIIFHSSSKMPRSAKFNLTVDMLGSNIDLFEMDLRAEGLDKIVDKMFGAGGYFGSSSKGSWMPYSRRADSDISMDLKIFGNSLYYKHLGESDATSETFSLMDMLVEMAKENEVELTKGIMFLDTVVTLPIGSGMPLKLALNGSAVLNLKLNGKVDAKSLQNLEVRGLIKPSGAIQISALMSVDAGVARTGLKMESTLHTSTLLDGLVQVRNGKIFQARLNVPREQYEIVDVQSRIMLVTKDGEREQKPAVRLSKAHTSCVGSLTRPILGMEVCSEVQLPAAESASTPPYPFSGPAKLRLFLRKTDPALTHYKAEAKWTEDKSGREVTGQHLVVSLNTPESRTDREVSAEFHLNKQDSTVAMKLKVPGKKLALIGKRIMNPNEKRLSVAVSVDDQEKFSASASMNTESIEGGVRHQHALEITGPSSRLLNIRSSASLKNLKYSGEITIEELTQKPIVINGEMTMGERGRYDVSATVDSHALSTKAKGQITLRNGFTSKMNVQYRVGDGRKENFEITGKVRDLSASGLTKYSGAASLASSEAPELTTSVTWETQYTRGHVENSFDLTFGDGKIHKVHKISMSEIFKYRGSIMDNSADGTFRLTYPQRDIDLAVQLNHKYNRESLLNDINVKYGQGREASSKMDLKFKTRPLALTGDLQIKYPSREIRLQGDLTQNSNREYVSTVVAQWQRGRQARAVATIRDSSTKHDRSYEAKAEITLPNSRPISLTSEVHLTPDRYAISADGEFQRGSYGVKGELTQTTGSGGRASASFRTPKAHYTAQAILEKNGQVVTGKVDVNIPESRRIMSTVEFSNGNKVKTGSAELMWDADRDQSKRVQISSELRSNSEGNQGRIDFKSPFKTMSGSYNANYAGKFANGIMKGNLRTELEWDGNQKAILDFGGNMGLRRNRRQVNGEVKLMSPVAGYENFLLTIQHVGSIPEWNNKIALQWKKNKKFVIGSEGKIRSDSSSSVFDTTMKINTPFQGFESLSLREVFEKRPSEVVSTSSIQYAPGKVVELSLSGSTDGSNTIRAGANLTTPFSTLRDASVALTNTLSKNTVDTGMEVHWNQHNSVSLNFDGRNLKAGKKHTCSAELKLASSFPKYEKLSHKIEYNSEPRIASLQNDFRWNSNKVTVALKGENKNTRDKVDMEGKMEYFSNFKNYEKGEIRVAQEIDSQSLTYTVESSLPYDKKMNLKLQGSMTSYKEMDGSLSITSSFADDIGTEIAYKMEGNRLVANGVANYGSKKFTCDVSGTTEVSRRSWNVDYRVNANTPLRGLEDLKFSLTQSKKGRQYTTLMKASKNQKAISVNHNLKIDDILNFENSLKMSTPFAVARNVEINIQQSGKPGAYKHNTETTWGSKKTSLSAEINHRSQGQQRNIEASLNAKTPFEPLRRLDITYQQDSNERSHSPSLKIEWNDNRKVSLEGSLQKNDRLKNADMSIGVETSFPGYESLRATGKYDLTKREKTAELSYKLNDRETKTYSIRGVAEADNNAGQIDITATTPIQGYERAQLKGDYSLSNRQNLVNLLVQYGEKKYALSGKHERNSRGAEVSAQATTPIRGYDNVAASASYALANNEISTQASYKWNEKEVALDAEYRQAPGNTIGKLTVKTPFDGYRNFAAKMERDMQSPRKTGSIQVTWDPRKTMELRGEFESDYSRFGNAKIEFRSPFQKYEELSASGSLKKTANEFGADAEARWSPNGKVSFAVEAKPGDVVLTFDSPFRPFRNVRLVSKISSGAWEASSEWDNSKKADVSARYTLSEKVLEGKVEANIPMNGRKTYSASYSLMNDDFKRMEGRADLRTPAASYETSALVRLEKEKKEITVAFQGPVTKVTLNGNLNHKMFREMEGSLKLDSNAPSLPSFSLRSSLVDSGKKIRFETDLNDAHHVNAEYVKRDGYEIRAGVKSSLLPGKEANINAIADPEKPEMILSAEVMNKKHTLKAWRKCGKTECEQELEVTSPLVKSNKASLNVAYSQKDDGELEGKVTALYDRKPHSIEMSLGRRQRDLAARMSAKSDALPSGTIDLEGKFSRPTEDSLEASLTARTGASRHSLTAAGKIQDKHMDISASLDSSAISPISLTASLDNDNYRNIEASAALKTSAGDGRARFTCRRDGWKLVESSFEMSLPVEGLNMVRADAVLRSVGPNQMEGNVDIKTSLKSLPKASMTGKAIATKDIWDAQLDFKLPFRKYENMSVLATVHPQLDQSRVTVALPDRTIYFPENRSY